MNTDETQISPKWNNSNSKDGLSEGKMHKESTNSCLYFILAICLFLPSFPSPFLPLRISAFDGSRYSLGLHTRPSLSVFHLCFIRGYLTFL